MERIKTIMLAAVPVACRFMTRFLRNGITTHDASCSLTQPIQSFSFAERPFRRSATKSFPLGGRPVFGHANSIRTSSMSSNHPVSSRIGGMAWVCARYRTARTKRFGSRPCILMNSRWASVARWSLFARAPISFTVLFFSPLGFHSVDLATSRQAAWSASVFNSISLVHFQVLAKLSA